MNIKAVLFDLDGTLVDSAPDLAAAADKMRTDRGLAPYPLEKYRHLAGAGARGMLEIAFGITPQDSEFNNLREEFFQNYEKCMFHQTQTFEGITTLLDQLQEKQIMWGIVTNKMERFSLPLIKQADWAKNCQTLISGDTTPHMKPHPAPMLAAAQALKIHPQNCLYIDDDLRDIQAGQAAHMVTVAATWGYLGKNSDVTQWQADHIAHKPQDILKYLN